MPPPTDWFLRKNFTFFLINELFSVTKGLSQASIPLEQSVDDASVEAAGNFTSFLLCVRHSLVHHGRIGI